MIYNNIRYFFVIVTDDRYGWYSNGQYFTEEKYLWTPFKTEKDAIKELDKIKYKVVQFKEGSWIKLEKIYFVHGIFNV